MPYLLVACTNNGQSENIWLPDRKGDTSQQVNTAQKEDLSTSDDSTQACSVEGILTRSTNDGRRLYVGNIPYAARVEDLRDFFKEFSL